MRADAHKCAQIPSIPESRFPNPDFKPVPEDDGTGFRFQEFWQAYPDRNGKKLEKAQTEALFRKLSIKDQALAVIAARNYAEALKDQGISAKDPKRFLRDGKGHEPWRDWIEPAQPVVTGKFEKTPKTCQERVRSGNFLKLCGEPSVTVLKGRPLCQQHKEHHERKQHSAATA